MEITNVYELEEHLMGELPKFLEYADVDEDSIHSFIQHCLKDAD
jgi:hypothetical protein